MQITLDIETIADERAMAAVNYDLVQDEFPPWPLLQIACVSLLMVGPDRGEGRAFQIRTFSRADLNERVLIGEVERAVADASQVLTYNGRGFDVPVLLARAAACGVAVPAITRLHSRVRPGLHLDVLDMVTANGSAPRPKLAHLCACLSIPAKMDAAGGGVAGLVAAGEWLKLSRYCETDVVATWLAHQLWESTSIRDLGSESWGFLADWIRSDQPRLQHLLPYTALPPESGGGPRLGLVEPRLVF